LEVKDMLYLKTLSSSTPAKVVIEMLPDGTKTVRLADNIETVESEEETAIQYDEVVFDLPEDRDDSVESITANFEAWWDFGQQETEEITLEQRVSDLEEALLSLLEG